MSRTIKDEELREYQKELGSEQYRALYLYEANKVRRLMRNNIRHSGKDYVNLDIDVHTCGYAFCKECKKKLNEFTGKKLADYERKLVEEFIK